MVAEWLGTSWTQAGLVALSAVCIDAATTIAIGTIFASVTISSTSLTNGLVGLVVIFALQKLLALGRLNGHPNRWVDNRPQLLMFDGEFLQDRLRDCDITPTT